jgi:hypothetical protein
MVCTNDLQIGYIKKPGIAKKIMAIFFILKAKYLTSTEIKLLTLLTRIPEAR